MSTKYQGSGPIYFALYRDNLSNCTRRSPLPPKFGAAGGLNTHSISTCIICERLAKSWQSLMLAILDCKELFDPTKDFPQPEKNFFGFSLQLMRRRMQLIVESVAKSKATSRWTARTTKHVKRCMYPGLFLPCSCRTS